MTEKDSDKVPERKFDITVDNKRFSVSSPITGAQIKKLVGAPSDYGVWLVVPGPAEDDPIEDNQRVDLTRPGVEKFITGRKQTTEGSDARFLPEADRDYLTEKGVKFEEHICGGNRGVIIRGYPLPAGRFNATRVDLLILIPPGYPDAAPDMFYLLPWVRLADNNAFPRAADQPFAFEGNTWQRWSRHNEAWRPGIDGIWSMLKRVENALQVAA